ncbi:MAG: 1-acyl-sn-glycerol-3-phosphate acyltransferase [Pseudomonadota bacterium]
MSATGLSRTRALLRCAQAIGLVCRGLWTMHRHFGHATAPEREQHIRQWSRDVLQVFGVHLEVRGLPAGGVAGLVVANHISWLDILIINAAHPVRFVAKSDVGRWPLLGKLVTEAGTLMIERTSRRDAMRVVHHMTEDLRQGHAVAVFPEGTTHDGSAVLPFHANLIQAAISAPCAVIPVGLSYWPLDSEARALQGKSLVAAFVGDMTLVQSVWSVLRRGPVHAVVHWGSPQLAQGRDRRGWARALEQEVAQLSQSPAPPRTPS